MTADVDARRSRLRLVVIQVLVFSLFATLVARVYYLQVVGGEHYRAEAASQSVREIVQQPARGLIVDAMGRPLVANRTSWVVSIDTTLLDKLGERDRGRLVARVAAAVHVPARRISASLLPCGSEGARRGRCWNGSPYQPVPVAVDVRRSVALRILEQPEDFPSVLAEQQSLRSYPSPYGVNLAHVLGYLSPVTEDELDRARRDDDASVNAASVVGRAGVERSYDRWLRGMPGYRSVAVDSVGRVLGDDSVVESTPGDTLVTSIDARVQSVAERQLAGTIRTARQTYDEVTHKNYVADSGAVVVMEARTGRIVAMASQPTYDPATWVGGVTQRQLERLYSARAGTPLLSRATQGQFAPGSTWKPFMAVGALDNGFTPASRLDCSSGLQVGNRLFKNYESASFGMIVLLGPCMSPRIVAWHAGMFGRYFSIHIGGTTGSPCPPHASMSTACRGPTDDSLAAAARSSISVAAMTDANSIPNRSGRTAPFGRFASCVASPATMTPICTVRDIAFSDLR